INLCSSVAFLLGSTNPIVTTSITSWKPKTASILTLQLSNNFPSKIGKDPGTKLLEPAMFFYACSCFSKNSTHSPHSQIQWWKILNPPPSEALKRMHMLAADPGIVAVMNKHRWRVGIMTEMAPIGYVGVSPKCILGFNKNHGEEISLRLRTDDLKGFRKYESIKKTLLHELAHMIYSEHDANFYALDKQLNQEASSLDWTRSASHTLSGVRNTTIHEDDFIADSSSIPQKLGGNRTDQIISARESSVAAAYHRLANVSANKSGGSEVNQELDLDYSSFNMSEKSDCMISASKEIEDIDMAIIVDKGLNGEPDPDDHIINGMIHEPDPDDSHHGKSVGYDVSLGITDGKTVFKQKPNDFGVAQVLHSEASTGNMAATYTSIDPYPDDSETSTKSIASVIVVEAIAGYSTSALERAIVFCFLLFQETTFLPIDIQKPVVDRLSMGDLAQSASQ
ncbi:hypothetical protein CR513_27574, partial [Mucuna pruriens]